MGLKRVQPLPALIVPDEETWIVFGRDPTSRLEPAEPGRARVLVLPEQLPHALVDAVRAVWEMDPGRATHTYPSVLAGVPARDALERPAGEEDAAHREHGDHDGQGAHEGPGGHDHGDMMAITGEPSADGLVMEDLDVHAGPVAFALPGGLVLHATLDGDVVRESRVHATLSAAGGSAAPDPWSALAWATAEMAARERASGVLPAAARWFQLAAVEVERAVSHLAWLHSFCRLLGWAHMTARVRRLLDHSITVRSCLPVAVTTPDLPDVPTTRLRGELHDLATAIAALRDALRRSRSFGRRTAGLGHVTHGDVIARGLAGPVARASGAGDDTRGDDPGYSVLGFQPVVDGDGDGRARALVRVAEVAQSLRLAAAAIARADDAGGDDEATPRFGRPPGGVVESARGPVCVLAEETGEPRRTAPGARAARDAAGELAVGREWAAALATIASFDISPWRIAP